MTRLLLSDVVYINGLSLRALPFAQRLSALKKEVVAKVHEMKGKDANAIQNASIKSVGLRECWPVEQLKKLKQSLLPSLTHEAEGNIVIDAASPYVFGEEPSREWLYALCVCEQTSELPHHSSSVASVEYTRSYTERITLLNWKSLVVHPGFAPEEKAGFLNS